MDYVTESELVGWQLIDADLLADVINRLIRDIDDLQSQVDWLKDRESDRNFNE